MEGISFSSLVELVKVLGLPGVIFVVWYFGERSHHRTRSQYSREMAAVREKYEKDMSEIRRMYENNVELVKRFIEVSSDLKDVVVMNTQAWQRAADDINRNQFCPNVRLKKEATGVQR